jgi:hypothetical protein
MKEEEIDPASMLHIIDIRDFVENMKARPIQRQ